MQVLGRAAFRLDVAEDACHVFGTETRGFNERLGR
jgi:hypothetical protein